MRWYDATIHPVVFVEAMVKDLGDVGTRDSETGRRRRELGEETPLTFDRLAYVKQRFPSRKAQYCTEYLKLRPQLRWMNENADGLLKDGFERYSGIRADESALRASQPEREWDDFFDCYLNRPILHWTKEQVFAYLKEAGEEVNPLYRMGFGRVGCAPCINSSKEDIHNWATRFPEMIDKIRRWEQSVGRTFFYPMIPARDYDRAMVAWKEQWLVSGSPTGANRHKVVVKEGAPPPPERPINWIDDVVAWSKTTRGGRQISLPFAEAEADSGACSSKYGLCD